MDPSPTSQLLVYSFAAPMFREPDRLSEQVSQALLGAVVDVIEAADGWLRIRTADGYAGWAERRTLVDLLEGWHAPWAEVTDLWINLRERPEYRMATFALASIGARLPLLQREGDWVQLLTPRGQLWTEAHRTTEVGEAPVRPAAPNAVCRTARGFLGIPYLWGGTSPLGLDCSGFVQLVMRLHGVPLLRDADQQATQGEPVTEPDAGDLLFFATGRDPQKISHVAMMLSRRRFIHAAGGDRVRVNRLSDPPYGPQILFARRVLPPAE